MFIGLFFEKASHYITLADLELTVTSRLVSDSQNWPAFVSGVLGLRACATTQVQFKGQMKTFPCLRSRELTVTIITVPTSVSGKCTGVGEKPEEPEHQEGIWESLP